MYRDTDFNPRSEEELREEERERELQRRIRREVRRIQSGEADEEMAEERAREEAEAEKLVRDAHLLSRAGCFGIVLEKIPAALAARVTGEVPVPTIGIGAGGGCDGQVLVIHDMLGINKGFSPRFLRRYADLHTAMTDAVTQYVGDVKSGSFPNTQEQY